MKKIVAIVLAMVMVLGLATTAFAATTSTGSVVSTSVTVKNPALSTLDYTNGKTPVAATITDIDKTTVTGKVVEDVAMYVPNIYEFGGKIFIEVAKADANYELKNNGAYVYLYEVAGTVAQVIDAYATAVVMDKFVAGVPAALQTCGDCADNYYVSATGDLYYAAGTDFAYMNGQFVAFEAASKNDVDLVPHTWLAKNVTYKGVDALGHQVPVSIKCDECEKTFAVVGATKFDNTWVKGVNYTTDQVVDGSYIVLKAVASAPVAGETVESAKTFDAGIAMYVGMSVMAAAGSAVVLKKKD